MSDKKIQILIYILMLVLAFLVGTLLYDATMVFIERGIKPSNFILFGIAAIFLIHSKRSKLKPQKTSEIKPETSEVKKLGVLSSLFNALTGSIIPTAKDFLKKDGPSDKK